VHCIWIDRVTTVCQRNLTVLPCLWVLRHLLGVRLAGAIAGDIGAVAMTAADAAAIAFWTSTLAEAEKVVQQHSAALSAALLQR
jgi:hypothetical protein